MPGGGPIGGGSVAPTPPTPSTPTSGPLRFGTIGCPCCAACNYVTVRTFWCTANCVAPGVITVTVRHNNAGGSIACTGTADANGDFQCVIPSFGNYYFEASTTTSGFDNLPVTLSLLAGVCRVVQCSLFPSTLTIVDSVVGNVTIVPSGSFGLPIWATYTGTNTYSFPGGCGCAASTVTIRYGLSICANLVGPLLTVTCNSNAPALIGPYCPNDAGPFPNTSGLPSALMTGSGPGITGGGCYAVNMSGNSIYTSFFFGSPIAYIYGICTGPGTVPWTITQ